MLYFDSSFTWIQWNSNIFIQENTSEKCVCDMASILSRPQCVNTLRPRQNGRRFADDTFKRIFLNENVRISIKILLKFVPKGQIDNIPALVQIMAWRRSGDKPLSEPMMVSLLTHICVTRPQCVKSGFHYWWYIMWYFLHGKANNTIWEKPFSVKYGINAEKWDVSGLIDFWKKWDMLLNMFKCLAANVRVALKYV